MLFQNSVSLRTICWLFPKSKIPIALFPINTHPQRFEISHFQVTYIALSEFGNFSGTLEVMICDRLVCGMNNGAILKWLLAEPKLTYAKAVEITGTAAQSIR